ncbi:maltose ABC transporter substrate-binding protein [Clostridium sp. 19966]|uniref:sugar ABC transporter substrate-binding protein n=1 Tax=Clostridium sp. 19966 TaxID=2768166 RepID=UPI0028DF98C5|nr:maltose ABC transporter substrate-binding protein [Clostridium sp. 19966]MDT8717085.1 maltose ABC transporter substrate-binding protein [Clostridium sp. 19966]
MNKHIKTFLCVLTTAVMTFTVVGCSKSNGTSGKTGKTLTVWSHFNQSEVTEIDKLAQEWAKKTGNKVKVLVDNSDFQAFKTAAQSSKGPDVMFGIAHDNLATFQQAGLLDEVPSGVLDESKYANKQVLDALTWDGKKYGFPIAMETYALFYNKDKVKEAPKTTDELIDMAKQNGGFQYDINNFYYSYAWISGEGGYVFKKTNGSYDKNDTGLGSASAVKAYDFIQSLTQKDKFMNGDIKGDDAKASFINKKTAFYISGAWDVEAIQKAGINFGVANLPTIDGNTAKPFMGVQAGFVNAKSKSKTEAWDLVKYLIENSAEPLIKTGHRIPVLTDALNSDAAKNDVTVSAFSAQTKDAEIMPNISAMAAIWTPVGNNLQLLTQGKQTPQQTADNIAKQVKEGIAQQK